MTRLLFCLCFLACLAVPALPAERFFLRGGERVVFLGDSITNAGMYIQYVDGYLATRFPDRKFELLNLGLSSETVTGLSEPEHPFPRPDVHERLERVLAQTKPDVVLACYGMNDGIYYPFSEERLAKYQERIRSLVEKVRRSGARLVLLTPPPFDPRPLAGKVLPEGAPKYSWMAPYAGYNNVLSRYAEWLLTLRKEGISVVDTRRAVSHHLEQVRRSDPSYQLAGDGVHMNGTGHWPMAAALLEAWHAPAEVDAAELDARKPSVRKGDVMDLAREGEGLRFRWTSRLPMPADPSWDRRLEETEKIREHFNRYRLVVKGLTRPRYTLWEGDRRLGDVDRKELEAGLDLLRFPELSTNRRAAEVGAKVQQRQRLLGPAWLTAVGHKRPSTAAGLPLPEAQAKAAVLDAEIRALAQPVALELKLTPAEPQ